MLDNCGHKFHIEMLGQWKKSTDVLGKKNPKDTGELISRTGFDIEAFHKHIIAPPDERKRYVFGDHVSCNT
jgi:hypothetical protein